MTTATADIGARHLHEAQSKARHRYKLVAEPAAIRADKERTLKERRRLDEHPLNRLRCQKLHFNIASGTLGSLVAVTVFRLSEKLRSPCFCISLRI